MKRIVSIQDLSCIGKCSQTVALPIISSMGVEVAVLPTSMLSTHTAFKEFTFKNLVDELKHVIEHWKKENFSFDVIYIGYTGTEEILDFVLDFIKQFKTNRNIVIFDPAMADNGEMYKGINKSIIEKMKEICKKADIIKPNLTECSLLLGRKYKDKYNLNEVKEIAKELKSLESKNIIITGAENGSKIGAVGYDGINYYSNFEKKYNANYHGTGDVFTSVLTGCLARENDLETSIKIATKFTTECVRLTYEDIRGREYGVNFEEAIPYLIKLINE